MENSNSFSPQNVIVVDGLSRREASLRIVQGSSPVFVKAMNREVKMERQHLFSIHFSIHQHHPLSISGFRVKETSVTSNVSKRSELQIYLLQLTSI